MKMRITKLRRVIRESIRDVLSEGPFDHIERKMKPGPSHASKGECPLWIEWEDLYRIAKSMRMRSYGEPPTSFLKAWNRYKFKKGYNLPPMLYDEVPSCAHSLILAAQRGGYDMSEEAYQKVCEAWMEDADGYSDFSWNYDPDTY